MCNNNSRFILQVFIQAADNLLFRSCIHGTQTIIENNKFGSLISALAMDIRCFCPPLNVTPLSPIMVSYWFENPSISLSTLACLPPLSPGSKLAYLIQTQYYCSLFH